MGEYRIVESYGSHFNKRWEVQEKYSYYENGERISSWHMVFHSQDKTECEKVMQKYLAEPKKDYKIPCEDALQMWN